VKYFYSLCYVSDNVWVDLIFVLDFSKRNIQSGRGTNSELCRVLRIWDQLWWVKQKVHLAQGVVLDHE